MPRIFISYRREDNRHAAGRIFDQLVQRLGDESVFKDVHSIPPSTDFEQYIKESIRAADIALVVMGEHWLTISDDHGNRRLDDPEDLVRKELEYCIQSRIGIIPVLVDTASMPDVDELPSSLRLLTKLQAAHLRDRDFKYDFENLFEAIKQYEERKRQNIALTAPESSNEKITGEHLALIYSCWRAPQHDQRWGQEVYRFDIILEAAQTVLQQVERVVYLLPPAWPTSPKEVGDRASAFGLKELTWGDLLARARVHIRNQEEPVYLSCYVRLSQHGPRLVKVS
jgi:hypothetical protein